MTAVAPALSSESEFAKVEQIAHLKVLTDDEIVKKYSLKQIAAAITAAKYKIVGLQVSDALIAESVSIYSLLSKLLGAEFKLVIMADTSYSGCCVDEVAAEHFKADVIVHFGRACLSPTRSIDVIYCFGEAAPISESQEFQLLLTKFKDFYQDSNEKILLVADLELSLSLLQLYNSIKDQYQNVCIAWPRSNATIIPELPSLGASSNDNQENSTAESDEPVASLPSRNVPSFVIPSEYSVFFLSDSNNTSPSLTLHLQSTYKSLNIIDKDMASITPQNKLMKRYRYMTQARSASTIGILVNTLSMKNILEVMKRVQNWITRADKKYYTFVVGKPNVPKLANFDVIDIWVVLGCPQGGIPLDSDNFYKPVITPYELHLALQTEHTWPGIWPIEFDSALELEQDESGEPDADDDEDAPEFDPYTGKLVYSRPMRQLKHIQPEVEEHNSALTNTVPSELMIRGTVSTAADYLSSKLSWTGLGSDHQHADGDGESFAKLEKGRSGIARDYSAE